MGLIQHNMMREHLRMTLNMNMWSQSKWQKTIKRWLTTSLKKWWWNCRELSRCLQRRQWQPTPVLLPGNSHGWRSLVESDMTEWLPFHSSLSCTGEGHGNPLQCSCLENPRDGGAWWAAVYGVAQSLTWLKRLSSSRENNAVVQGDRVSLHLQDPPCHEWGRITTVNSLQGSCSFLWTSKNTSWHDTFTLFLLSWDEFCFLGTEDGLGFAESPA